MEAPAHLKRWMYAKPLQASQHTSRSARQHPLPAAPLTSRLLPLLAHQVWERAPRMQQQQQDRLPLMHLMHLVPLAQHHSTPALPSDSYWTQLRLLIVAHSCTLQPVLFR